MDLVISEAIAETLPSKLPSDLSDGAISIGEVRWENSIPLPLDVSVAVLFTAVTVDRELLTIRGTGASVVARGDLRYVEEYAGSSDD